MFLRIDAARDPLHQLQAESEPQPVSFNAPMSPQTPEADVDFSTSADSFLDSSLLSEAPSLRLPEVTPPEAPRPSLQLEVEIEAGPAVNFSGELAAVAAGEFGIFLR